MLKISHSTASASLSDMAEVDPSTAMRSFVHILDLAAPSGYLAPIVDSLHTEIAVFREERCTIRDTAALSPQPRSSGTAF